MTYEAKYVRCPFFEQDTKTQITCEGIISELSIQLFATEQAKKRCIRKYCMNDFERCNIYYEIMKKYDE